MENQYKVVYIENNKKKEKLFNSIKEISKAFDIPKETIFNIYTKIHGVSHDNIISIERLSIPLKSDRKILINFD